MSPAESQPFVQSMRRIEALVEQIEHSTDPAARAAAQEMVRTLLDLHHTALAKVLELLQAGGQPGRAVLEAWVRDDLVNSVLLLHQLHPEDLPTRVGKALEQVRLSLRSHGDNVEVLDVSDGRIRLRMQSGGHSCHSSAASLRALIEQAIVDAAPDVTAVEWEEPPAEAAPVQLVQVGSLLHNGRAPQPAGEGAIISSGSR